MLLAWLSAACYFDYRRDRIPNRLIAAGAAAGLIYRIGLIFSFFALKEAAAELLSAAGGVLLWAGIIFLVFYPLYKLGVFGAGDVKLFCLLPLFLKGVECVYCLGASLAIGALLGTVKLLRQGSFRERLAYFCSYTADVVKSGAFFMYLENGERKKASVHMAGAVFLGVLLHGAGLY